MRLLRYINGNNVEFPNTGNFLSGTGFWLITRGARTLGTGSGTSISTGQNYVITLSPGWNQIGNPYDLTISWNQVLEDNGSPADVGQLQVFSGTTQSTGNTMNPFTGGFVFADAATSVSIDPTTAAGGRRLTTAVEKIKTMSLIRANG